MERKVDVESTSEELNIQVSHQHQRQKWTFFHVYCLLTISLGSGFTFGYNVSVINGPYIVMNAWLNETFVKSGQILTNDQLSTEWSVAVTLYLIGGIVGSTWFPTACSAYFGKRNSLIWGSVIGFVGEIVLFIARYSGSYFPFMIGRALAGFQGGFSMVIAPGLINEHAPAMLRGPCGTIYSIGISAGVELGNLLALSFILGSASLWPYLFVVISSLFVIHGIGLIFVVESPRWLLDKKREREAIAALAKLRNVDEDSVRDEFEETKRNAEVESAIKTVSFASVFGDRQLWWPMIVVIALHIANQLTGLGAVLMYATMVMNGAGLEADRAAVANFGVAFAMIVGSLFCAVFVNRTGRRWFMLLGTVGMFTTEIILVIVLSFDIYQAAIACFALFLIFFGLGPAPIPWFMPAEMFTQASRPLALAVAMFTNYVGNIIVSFVFPALKLKIAHYAFLPFAAIGIVDFVFLLFFLPETTPGKAFYSQTMFAPGQSLIQLRKKQPQNEQDGGENNLIVNECSH